MRSTYNLRNARHPQEHNDQDLSYDRSSNGTVAQKGSGNESMSSHSRQPVPTPHDGGQSNRINTNANDQDLGSQPDQQLQTPTWRDLPTQQAMSLITTSQNIAVSQTQATSAPDMLHTQLVPGTSQLCQASYLPQQMPLPTTWQQPARTWTGIPNQQFGMETPANEQTQEHEDLKKKYAELERELSLL